MYDILLYIYIYDTNEKKRKYWIEYRKDTYI